MADLVKKIKIKKQDGTFTDYILIGAEAQNISTSDGDSVQLKLNKKPYYYNSVADMKADNKLKVGDMAITLGYYSANDGGEAEYKIIAGEYTDDGLHQKLTNNLFAELIINNKEINILQVGGKADNSSDIGELINYYTLNYNIFLPNGRYKVSTSISLHNDLRGTAYPRCGGSNAKYAWLVDNLQSGAVVLISNSGNTIINVSNFGIECNSSDYGIKYDPVTYECCYIHHIFIKNLSKTGIACLSTNRTVSRGCYVDTVCIFGKAYQQSIGIINNNADSYYTNIEIMGTQTGIRSVNDLRLSDAHIWCGSMSGHDQDEWWHATRGIICQSNAIINNLYLDTCFCPIVSDGSRNNKTILINNFQYWMDASVEESSYSDGTLALTWPNTDDNRFDNIVINNGYIYSKGKIANVGLGRFNNITWLVHNINEITDYHHLYGETPVKYSLRYVNEQSHLYNLIGIIQYNNQNAGKCGILKFKWAAESGQNVEFTIYNKWDSFDPIITPLKYYGNNTERLFYKKENGFIYIYALSTNTENKYSVYAEQIGLVGHIAAIDLARIRIRNNDGSYSFIKETLTSPTGLTEIPRGERLDPVEG